MTLVSSDVLDYEIARNPNLTRLEFAQETLSSARTFVRLTDAIETLSKQLNKQGIAALDSLHLACAEMVEANFFCTCDDLFLKKAKRVVRGAVKVVSPLELAEELENWQSRRDR